jgi:adenine phosphoribosyltransferase
MKLHSLIRTVPDFPKKGVQFRDVTTLLKDADGLRAAVDGLASVHRSGVIDMVVGIEARGFIFGTAVAYALSRGFVPIRKQGKLPGRSIGRSFELEYGADRIEIHRDSFGHGARVLLIDDLIATGGTAQAAVELLREVGAVVVECAFVVALPDLGGVARLRRDGCEVRWLCEFPGQ